MAKKKENKFKQQLNDSKLDEKYLADNISKVDARIYAHQMQLNKYGHRLKKSKYYSKKTKSLGRPVDQDRLVRVQTVARCSAMGMMPQDIYEKYKDKWGVEKTAISQYLREAREIFTKDLLVDDQLTSDILSKYYYLYRLAIEEGDRKEARAVLDSIQNLTKTIRIDITSNGKEIQPPSVIELFEVGQNDAEDIDFEEENDDDEQAEN